MGRRQKEETESDLLSIEPDELDDVLSGLPSEDSLIRLFRVTPQGKPAFITEFSPLEFSLEGVKNTYGGGKYKYVAKSPGGIRQGFFEIEGQSKDGSGNKPIYKRYIGGKLVYSKPEDAEVIVGGPDTRQQAPGDSVSILMLNELRALRESLQRPIETADAIKKSFLEEMLVFKQLFGDDKKSPTEDFSKMALDLIKQGIEVGAMAENGGSPWLMVLDKVLPTVQEALKTFSVQQQRGNILRPIQPPASNAINAPVPGDIPLTGFGSIADKLRAYLPTFLSAASSNSDPAILVDLTSPQIQEKDKAIVQEWFASEKWFADLCTLHPLIQGQQAWWQEYRDGLLLALQSNDKEGHNDETETE
jgi:hypothetical protein